MAAPAPRSSGRRRGSSGRGRTTGGSLARPRSAPRASRRGAGSARRRRPGRPCGPRRRRSRGACHRRPRASGSTGASRRCPGTCRAERRGRRRDGVGRLRAEAREVEAAVEHRHLRRERPPARRAAVDPFSSSRRHGFPCVIEQTRLCSWIRAPAASAASAMPNVERGGVELELVVEPRRDPDRERQVGLLGELDGESGRDGGLGLALDLADGVVGLRVEMVRRALEPSTRCRGARSAGRRGRPPRG